VVKCFSPQEGQLIPSLSAVRRTSFSNLVPQSSQEYSYIGMLLRYKIVGREYLAFAPNSLPPDAGPISSFQPRAKFGEVAPVFSPARESSDRVPLPRPGAPAVNVVMFEPAVN